MINDGFDISLNHLRKSEPQRLGEPVAPLLDCPFCGQPPHDDGDPIARRVGCATPGCAVSGFLVPPDQWNRRALRRIAPAETLKQPSQTASLQRLVVCAAIRSRATGTIVCGPRHGNCLNAAVRFGLYDPGTGNGGEVWECGFVDAHGAFMDRAEAWRVADAVGQIRRPTGHERHYENQRRAGIGDEGLLFSENLY